jgi:calcineurin-like phosphoesterase family protein
MGAEQRPYASVDEMNESLIANWNSVVKSGDEVWHLGDVGLIKPDLLRPILDRLNGRIRLIKGNHEHQALDKRCFGRFETFDLYKKLKVTHPTSGKIQEIMLFHYPIGSWDKAHHGSWHLHGHSHNSYKTKGKILDVGIDNPLCSHRPMSLEQVAIFMDAQELHVVDHHAPSTGRA